MKIVTVLGARPQFVKAAAVSRAIAATDSLDEVLVHTGQHHDAAMSAVFFDRLRIPAPHHHLGIAGGRHGSMTGRMLEAVERVLVEERPGMVLVYGDTNSTLAGALAAAKLAIPVAHVEAGVRSFDRTMPEEINRVVVDSVASLLFCPSRLAVDQLAAEGIRSGVHRVGDVMLDVALGQADSGDCGMPERLGVEPGSYWVCTVHRQANTDDPMALSGILAALDEVASGAPVVFPLHPRTAAAIIAGGLGDRLSRLRVVEPLPYDEMLSVVRSARAVLTDSGGLQKEAFFHRVPCVTLRSTTEWPETVELGWNLLAGCDSRTILDSVGRIDSLPRREGTPYGDGTAAEAIAGILAGQGA